MIPFFYVSLYTSFGQLNTTMLLENTDPVVTCEDFFSHLHSRHYLLILKISKFLKVKFFTCLESLKEDVKYDTR